MGTPDAVFVVCFIIAFVSSTMLFGSLYLAKLERAKGR